MDQKIMAEAAQELIEACSCCVELKVAAQNFLEAMDTPEVRAHLGDEFASMIKAHAEELKANGVEYCDCPACSAGMKIIKA